MCVCVCMCVCACVCVCVCVCVYVCVCERERIPEVRIHEHLKECTYIQLHAPIIHNGPQRSQDSSKT